MVETFTDPSHIRFEYKALEADMDHDIRIDKTGHGFGYVKILEKLEELGLLGWELIQMVPKTTLAGKKTIIIYLKRASLLMEEGPTHEKTNVAAESRTTP